VCAGAGVGGVEPKHAGGSVAIKPHQVVWHAGGVGACINHTDRLRVSGHVVKCRAVHTLHGDGVAGQADGPVRAVVAGVGGNSAGAHEVNVGAANARVAKAQHAEPGVGDVGLDGRIQTGHLRGHGGPWHQGLFEGEFLGHGV